MPHDSALTRNFPTEEEEEVQIRVGFDACPNVHFIVGGHDGGGGIKSLFNRGWNGWWFKFKVDCIAITAMNDGEDANFLLLNVQFSIIHSSFLLHSGLANFN